MVGSAIALPRVRFGCGGAVYQILATAADTNNTHFAFEAIEPPGGGPPLHTHAHEDEFFIVLAGEMTFHIGGRIVRAAAGQTAFVPRTVPHCIKNCSAHEARVLVMFTPGNIEGFFEYGLPTAGRPPSENVMLDRIRSLGPAYGLELLGPSPL